MNDLSHFILLDLFYTLNIDTLHDFLICYGKHIDLRK